MRRRRVDPVAVPVGLAVALVRAVEAVDVLVAQLGARQAAAVAVDASVAALRRKL